ncbi:MAG: ABC transporter ATP-binding protein [Clostridia bacterium]|nr:ABC transporter ATP-binding protein [Clostridia bacterium]
MIFGKHINKYYIRHLPVLLLGVLSLVVVDVAQLKVPEFYRLIINGLNDGSNVMDGVAVTFDMDFVLREICFPLIVVILLLVLGRFLWRICFFGSAISVETSIRDEMFDRCKDLSQQYYNVNKVGNLMSFYTNDLETIQDCFGGGLLVLCDALFLGGSAFFKMFRMNPVMTGFAMIPMAILIVLSILVGKKLTKKWDERQAAFSSLSDFAQESYSGIAVIKAFVKEARELSAYSRLNKNNEKANVEYVKASTLFNVMVMFFAESVVCVILGYGGYLVYTGAFDPGRLVEFIGYFTTMIWPIMAVSELVDMTSQGRASLRRVSELLDTKPDVADSPDVAPFGSEIRGEIEFRGLTFRYPGASHDSLHDVSVTIKAGENVGIIGLTGSGKTTLTDLILRTYNVPDGTLFIDGRDVNSVPIREVRDACAYVPQDNFLFSDTIKGNIAFSTDGATDSDVTDAAVAADIDGNISEFNDGYDTVLGERGVTVSGGQKQRISIARAILKNAKILILDDSVSAVDTVTERKIIENLRARRRGCTTILIAHRVSTVEQMDRIIFMEGGRVLMSGTHEELLENCPEYRRTVELQQLEEQEKVAGNA